MERCPRGRTAVVRARIAKDDGVPCVVFEPERSAIE